MKYYKRLKQQINESLPAWRDQFICYKDLKKLVRLISSSSSSVDDQPKKVEADFVYILDEQIDKFNSFFIENEEDFIIRHEGLQQRIQRVIATLGPNGSHPLETDYKEEMERIRNDIVNFHGEMVLLVNYSNINYTGLVKILKKYDKQTGGFLRLSFIQKVLEQPFYKTTDVSKLVKECENTIEAVFLTPKSDDKRRKESDTTTIIGQSIFRNTVAALVTMIEMRKSSTYSQFSLPPLNSADYDIIQSLLLAAAILLFSNQKEMPKYHFFDDL